MAMCFELRPVLILYQGKCLYASSFDLWKAGIDTAMAGREREFPGMEPHAIERHSSNGDGISAFGFWLSTR
jgi:hypothetical protein